MSRSDSTYTLIWTDEAPPAEGVDVVVRATDPASGTTYESHPLFAISETEDTVVDIVLSASPYVGSTEYARVSRDVDAAMGAIPAKDMLVSDIEYTATRADTYPPRVTRYAQAAKLADGTAVSPDAFYAFARAGLPLDKARLLMEPDSTLRAALLAGYEQQIIDKPGNGTQAEIDGAIAATLTAIDGMRIDAATTLPVDPDAKSMRRLLDTTGLSESEQREFHQLWLSNTGSVDDFWTSVETSPTFGTAGAATLKFTLHAAMATRQFEPALQALQSERATGSIDSFVDLARWTRADWESLFDDPAVGAPDDVPGETESERIANFAKGAARMVEEVVPTAVVANRVQLSVPAEQSDLVQFFGDNPVFDITKDKVSTYLADHPTALHKVSDPSKTTENLKTVQRLHNITPRFERADLLQKLYDLGYTSALQIAQMGTATFVAKHATELGTIADDGVLAAKQIAEAATLKQGISWALMSTFGGALAPLTTKATPPNEISQASLLLPGMADLETIFGSLDRCGCEHCRSVFGPASYLVELLEMLRVRPGVAPGSTAFSVLMSRRGDLEQIELSCKNANTVLPHVDLVIEQLEAMVTGGSAAHQTTLDTETLLSHPEHLDAGAYATLAGSDNVFPWALPFDLFDTEQRLYFEHLGVSRAEVMQALQGTTGPADTAIAAAALGLSPLEHDIISGAHTPTGTAAAYWKQPPGAGWAGALSTDVPLLLERSELSYEEMLLALDTDFIDRLGNLDVTFSSTDCDLADATIVSFDDAVAERLHRFVRLHRATERSVRQLDAAIGSIGGGDLDAAFLGGLAVVPELEARLGADPEAMFGWWGDLRTRVHEDGEGSLYQRLFLDSKFREPVDPAFELDSTGTELASVVPLGPEHVPTILAGLGISEGDYVLLRDRLPTANLDLSNLGELYRHASLAQHLGVSIPELVALLGITGATPFASPSATLALVDTVHEIRAAGTSIAELDYLMRHRFEPQGSFGPDVAGWTLRLSELVQGMQEIASDLGLDPLLEPAVVPQPDPHGDHVRAALEAAGVGLDDTGIVLGLMGKETLEPADLTTLDSILAPYWDTATPGADLDALAHGQLRYEHVWLRVLVHRRDLVRRDLLEQLLAELVGTTREVAHALSSTIVTSPTAASVLLDPTFLSTDLAGNPISIDTNGAQLDALERVSKAATVVRMFSIPASELQHYFGGSGRWMDLGALPLVEIPDGSASFTQWSRVRRGCELRSLMSGAGDPLTEVFGAASMSDALDALADHTGWDRDDLQALELAFGLTHPTDLEDADAMLRVRDAVVIVSRLGLDASTVLDIVGNAADESRTRELRASVKAKYGEERWPEVARPLRDELRITQRDALIAHVIENEAGLSTTEDLFAQLLMDPLMQPCALTSRIKLAISSVQQFIQRVFLGLEQLWVVFGEDDLREWQWMKNYRVWEANRKVFVYPENWVDPALRKDKTHLFETFESRLLQGDVNETAVRTAYLEYLHGLHDISLLDVVGVYHELDEQGDVSVTHVIARSTGTGVTYFHRRWIDQQRWTSWEPISLDIGSDILVPVVHNRRLYLFWAVPERRGAASTKGSSDGEPPKEELRVRIAWSEYRDGGWAPSRLTAPSPVLAWADTGKGPRDRALVINAFERVHATWGKGLFVQLIAAQHVPLGPMPKELHDYQIGKSAIWMLNDCSGELVYVQKGRRIKHSQFLATGFPVNAKLWSQRFELIDESTFQMATKPDYEQTEELFETVPTHRAYVTVPHQDADFHAQTPFFYKDQQRAFMISRFTAQLSSPTPGPDDVDPPEPDGFIVGYQKQLPPVDPPEDEFLTVGAVVDGVMETELFGGVTPGFAVLNAEGGLQTLPDALSHGDDASNAQRAFDQAVTNLSKSTEPHSTNQASPFSLGSDGFVFTTFHHPYTCAMLEAVRRGGIDGLLAPEDDGSPGLRRQLKADTTFAGDYGPTNVKLPYPEPEFEFEFGSAYGDYNWELFFHAPTLIAQRLTREHKFEEALRWHHYVFNPLDSSDHPVPARYWNVKPFYERTQDAAESKLMTMLGQAGTPEEQDAELTRFVQQVDAWRNNPFDPHLLARLRPGAYERFVVMSYLDTLFAWADDLFRRDTIESINEALQLYVMAGQLLGERPVQHPERTPSVQTYADVKGQLDAFGNAMVELESFPLLPSPAFKTLPLAGETPVPPPLPRGPLFCVPPNSKLLGYWDTLADRLFKIRNCQNIEGVFRQLPLYQPPIDPSLLVQAAAAGVDLGSAVAGLGAPLPTYRFATMSQRASELAADVRSLGTAMLQALEKRDAEALARLGNDQQHKVLAAVRAVRVQQIDEAQAQLDAATQALAVAEGRRGYYENLERISRHEQEHRDQLDSAFAQQTKAQEKERRAGLLGLLPNLRFGVSGIASPVLTFEFGGTFLAGIQRAIAASHSLQASKHQHEATKASIVAGWLRRGQEWDFQAAQAGRDIEQIHKQIAAAQVRLAVTEKELESHDQQIANAEELDAFVRSKFTGQELYDWTITQLSSLHFQAYQLALDVAKQAEQAYRHELAIDDASFVQIGHWDSLRKGLLAGERLQLELQRMRSSYLEHNRRELELSKNVSLAELDPVALVRLREQGECFVSLPEVLFDLDHPGHYMRRIKSVSVSVPAVTGPNTTLGMKLTLTHSSIRRQFTVGEGYARTQPTDARFDDIVGGTQAIATSSGRNDAGLFRLDFQDPRYLPFEGAGAVSDWRIQLPAAVRQFDYSTISDVVLHIQYTARDAGDGLRGNVEGELLNLLSTVQSASSDVGSMRMFSAARDFPSQWHEFLYQPDSNSGDHQLELPLHADRFPHLTQPETVGIDSVETILVLEPGTSYPGGTGSDLEIVVAPTPSSPAAPITLSIAGTPVYGQPNVEVSYGVAQPPGAWTLTIEGAHLDGNTANPVVDAATTQLDPTTIRDLLVIVHYTVS